MYLKAIYLTFILTAGCVLLCSCTTMNTGTSIPMDSDRIGSIQSVALSVDAERDFEVDLAEDVDFSGSGWGTIGYLFGGVFVGIPVADSINDSKNRKFLESLGYELNTDETVTAFSTGLRDRLVEQGVFTEVHPHPESAAESVRIQAWMQVTIRQWALVICPGVAKEQQVDLGIHYVVELLLADKGKPLWKKEEYLLSGECVPFESLRDEIVMLRRKVSEAINLAVSKITMELKYTK